MTWWAAVFTVLTFYGLQQGRQAHESLCVFRTDLETRLESTEKILRAQPHADPIVIYGLKIPRSQLETNAANQRKSVDSLANLDC